MSSRIALAAAAVILRAGQAVAAVEETAPPVYEDRLIESGTPARDDEDAVAFQPDLSGLPRSLQVEAGAANTRYGVRSQHEAGLQLSGYWDTLGWGSWSVSGMLRSGGADFGGNGSSLTLWQRHMPFADGWSADNGVGVLNSPSLPLMRGSYRFVLPGTAMAGAESEWRRGGDLQLQAAVGEPGFFEGGRWSAYRSTGGRLAQAGLQWAWSPQYEGALAAIDERDVLPWWAISSQSNSDRLPRADAQSVYAGGAWQTDSGRVQANFLASQVGGNPARVGAWIDAASVAGDYQQHYGLFRLDSGLSWGALPFSNNIEGGYYRVDYQQARWSWSAGVDQVGSISGSGVDGTYLNGGLRYQARPWMAFGGNLTIKPGGAGTYSATTFADLRSGWGISTLQFQQTAGAQGQRARQLSWDQSLPTREGAQVSVSASFAAVDSAHGGTTRSQSLAAYGSYEIGQAISLNGNLRWTRGQGPEGQRGLDGNVGLTWQLGPEWLFAATYYRSQAAQRSAFVIDPISQSTPFIALPGTRAFALSLRYQWRAGSPPAVLGNPAGGVGSISGSVFLDDNGNGRHEAAERGAANVTVVLDRSYSVRTDASGRFEFSPVGAGDHTIDIIPDNLPLPWMLDDRSAHLRLTVRPRDGARVDIGAKRS